MIITAFLHRLAARESAREARQPVRIEITLDDIKRAKCREIIADRKARRTAALRRFVAAGGVCPLRPRDQVVAGARKGA